MSLRHQPKAALINDFSGFGRCSVTVALPIISQMKVQCCPVLTSVFSNHTGYPSFYFDDYTEKMPSYIAEWKKLNLHFECIAAGFLGSEGYVAESFGVKLNARTDVETVNGSYRTGKEKIFTAGDMHRGQSLVVWAIAEGREAAKEVDKSLMGYTYE